ncbi:IclR family transcriptional regulator [Natrarchaeobius halalkaliphilus]|uniref:IclR family transcriptional regulator n=1 Tax=Natrarchaeobius halalkaliphilus TaxID=1679091 RepID=A0A3N6P061_9EURY|nr:IclR family transcriptional regulator [Natrarchaeobius halalkaliphilus]RQG87778.1 IclR family transcriptional regulator [Natrarchaeobius halalkaliphilus]
MSEPNKPTSETEPRTVGAVQTTLDIIDLLHHNDGAGVTELSTELGLSKGTVHSHLATLYKNEYLIKEDDEYNLSLRYLHLAETVRDRLGFYDVVREEVDELAQESGELSQFATEEHGQGVYIYKASGEKAVKTASSVGKREYLHCTSLGKAMLAHYPESYVDGIIDQHGLPGFTSTTITSRDELFDTLEEIRNRGYAIDNEERIDGLRCVAAPVLNNDGSVLGAVSLSGPSSRMIGERFDEELPSMVVRAANVIEINSQYS